MRPEGSGLAVFVPMKLLSMALPTRNRNRTPMTPEQASDMSTVLSMGPEPSTPHRMPPADLKVRLKTSPLLRRMLPTGTVLARAARRAEAIWAQSPEERSHAIGVMESVVAGTPRAGEIEELARAYLGMKLMIYAFSWQPWPMPENTPESTELLHDMLTGDRGVLVSTCHLGPFFVVPKWLASTGTAPYTVAGPWFFERPTHDAWGRRLAHWQKRCYSRMILSTGSFPILSALLERGDMVLLFFDLPGRHATRFLGKTAMLADGTARLAFESDAPVLPVRARFENHRVQVDVGEPLDPRDFPGVDALHEALALQHERWILELPHTLEEPGAFGWEDGATAQGWARPAPAH